MLSHTSVLKLVPEYGVKPVMPDFALYNVELALYTIQVYGWTIPRLFVSSDIVLFVNVVVEEDESPISMSSLTKPAPH